MYIHHIVLVECHALNNNTASIYHMAYVNHFIFTKNYQQNIGSYLPSANAHANLFLERNNMADEQRNESRGAKKKEPSCFVAWGSTHLDQLTPFYSDPNQLTFANWTWNTDTATLSLVRRGMQDKCEGSTPLARNRELYLSRCGIVVCSCHWQSCG